jgi:hypothetical protein
MFSMKRTPNPSTYGFAFGEGSVGGLYGSNVALAQNAETFLRGLRKEKGI